MVFVRNVGMQNRHFESKIGNLWDSFETMSAWSMALCSFTRVFSVSERLGVQ